MRAELGRIDWDSKLTGNTESCWSEFKDLILEVERRYVPTMKAKTGSRKAIWMTHRAWKMVAKKRKVFAKYKDRDHPAVRTVNKKTTKAIDEAKLNFEKKLAENIKKDTKSFFAYARGHNKLKTVPGSLVDDNGREVESVQEITEEFNNYFASVFTKEDPGGVVQCGQSASDETVEQLTGLVIEESEIKKKLLKMREDKAPGVDKLLPRLLCNVVEEICRPLWLIFNKSLEEGTVPDDWRRANVSPLFKNGCRNKAENYRPVSLTSQICKIFESLVRDAIVLHLEKLQLIRDSQHGFRKGRSCMTNLLTLLETVTKSMDDGDSVDVIFLDFAKAFDKVPHKKLLRKLENHGIAGKLRQWIESWLSDRFQRTCIKGFRSSWRRVTSGVPQGSVLGPILFLIYINDLDSGVMSWILKFADDTKIYRTIGCSEDRKILQQDLDRLVEWSTEWQMSFNEKKCKVMHIGKGAQHTYSMNNCNIEEVKIEKDLGVIISNDMKMLSQCKYAYAKANRMLGLIRRTIKCKSVDIMLRLYKSLVRPHVEYCSSVWAPHYVKDKDLIEKVQHRFTKMIPRMKHMQYEDRLKELGLWTLEERRHRADLVEAFKIVKGLSDIPCAKFFEIDTASRTRGHCLKLIKTRFSTSHRQHAFSQRVINSWNSLDQSAVEASTVNSFKNALNRLRATRKGLFLD